MSSTNTGAVLVTGACGLLGSAIVKELVAKDWQVVATDLHQSALQDLVHSSQTDHIHPIVVDLSSQSGIEALMDAVNNLPFTVSAAVHSAYPRSPGWGARIEDLQEHHLIADITTQLGVPILLSRALLEYFKSHGGGSLVHLSSIQGVAAPKFDHYEGTSMHSPVEYAAIKSGLISMTRWLAKYYSNCNIRVNCVSPGGILDRQPNAFLSRYRASCANIGMLSPSHVSSIVAFLLSSDAFAINGQNIVVDDGWTL